MTRTTVVGSYPKVTEKGEGNLPGVIDRWQKKALDDGALEQELRKVTGRVIREQEEAGIDLITDGQICWEDLPHPIVRASTGIKRSTLRRFFDNNVYYRRLEVDGDVRWTKSALSEEFRFASSVAKKPVKASLPGPLTLVVSTHLQGSQSREKLLSLYADLVRKGVEALAAAGAKEIQLEEPAFGKEEPLTAQAVEAVNRIFQGVKARRWVACYFQDVTPILPQLAKLQVEVLHLDLVAAPGLIEHLKKGIWPREISLGLLDARNTKLESAAELKKKISQITQAIPEERLWLSLSCGLEFLPHSSVLKKLQLLREAASD